MKAIFALIGAAIVMGTAAQAQPPGPPSGPIPSAQGGIVWFGTLKAGIAEARRTNRPILLISAVPHCHNVSGIW